MKNTSSSSPIPPIINERTVFLFYSFVTGFAIPLTFILIFYILVIIKLRSVGPRSVPRSRCFLN